MFVSGVGRRSFKGHCLARWWRTNKDKVWYKKDITLVKWIVPLRWDYKGMPFVVTNDHLGTVIYSINVRLTTVLHVSWFPATIRLKPDKAEYGIVGIRRSERTFFPFLPAASPFRVRKLSSLVQSNLLTIPGLNIIMTANTAGRTTPWVINSRRMVNLTLKGGITFYCIYLVVFLYTCIFCRTSYRNLSCHGRWRIKQRHWKCSERPSYRKLLTAGYRDSLSWGDWR